MITKADLIKTHTYHHLLIHLYFYIMLSTLLLIGTGFIISRNVQHIFNLLAIFPMLSIAGMIYYISQLHLIKTYAFSFKSFKGVAVAIEASILLPSRCGIVIEYTNKSGDLCEISTYHVFSVSNAKAFLNRPLVIYVSPESFYALIDETMEI